MERLMKTAAIYARVSSDQQKEENTIASQTAALMDYARREGYSVSAEWVFQDEVSDVNYSVRSATTRIAGR